MKVIVADENTRVTKELLDSQKPSRIVNSCRGRDHIDYAECEKRGIEVVETDYKPANSVADHAVAMLLQLVVLNPKATVTGEGEELAGKKALIVGAGRIGKAIHARLTGFGVEAYYYDPYSEASDFQELRPALKWCDYAFLACPLTPENKHLIGYQEFLRLRGKVLINIARAELVDPYYLNLFSNPFNQNNRGNPKRLVRVGWDFYDETLAEDKQAWSALFHASAKGKSMMTRHTAWRTREARARRENAVKKARKE